jgi:hypothetical protein
MHMFFPSSILSFAQNSDDISGNDSLRGSLLMVQEGIAYGSTPEEAHSMKLDIMTEYFWIVITTKFL